MMKTFFYLNRRFYICNIKIKKGNKMENTNLQQLEEKVDKIYDEQSRKLYDHIVELGTQVFSKENPLYKYKDTDLIPRLISHFESLEEYEKCSKLLKISRCIKGIQD